MDNTLEVIRVSKISLDFSSGESNNAPAQIVRCVQYDLAKLYVKVSLFNHGIPYQIPEDVTLLMEYRCQDGTYGEFASEVDGQDGYTISSDRTAVEFYIPSRMRIVEGVTKCAVRINGTNGEALHTPTFYILVHRADPVYDAI